jgi:hypothetical protein
MYAKPIPPYKRLHLHFKSFRKEIRDIWESYNLIDYYMTAIHQKVQNAEIETFSMPYLLEPHHSKQYSRKNTYGAISHIQRKANPRRTLTETVSTFEDYLNYLA